MTPLYLLLALVALERLGELVYASRNTRRLKARGGIEVAAEQYPFFIALHTAWLLAMFVFIPKTTPPIPWLLAAFVVVEAARVWTLSSLGPYWTTRVITIPGEPLVKRGPYRFVRHPNYVVVALEIAVLPLAFNAPAIAIAFTALNAALLVWRVQAENAVLDERL